MSRAWPVFLAGCVVGAAGLIVLHLVTTRLPASRPEGGRDAARAHTAAEFDVLVRAPFARVFPLFGAAGERAWSPEWRPRFVHPVPPADEPGAVFLVRHGPHEVPWVTADFDAATGHAQHVYVIPGTMAVRIDIRVRARDDSSTAVHVRYERTALEPGADSLVARQGGHDRDAAAHWQQALDAWAAKPR